MLKILPALHFYFEGYQLFNCYFDNFLATPNFWSIRSSYNNDGLGEELKIKGHSP